MRIRSTKPEFWRSKSIAALDWDVRLVLKGLESYVDDNGVGKDDLALIAADVFPRDLSGNPHETLRRLTEAISVIAEAGLIVRYERVGEDLIYIDRWKQQQYIQHPKAGRFPRPDGTMEYKEDVDPASYWKPHANCMTGSGDQRNRGSEEQTTTAREPEEFSAPDSEDVVDEVLDAAPAFVSNGCRPTPPQPTNAGRTVVRQTLGTAYPRTTIDRLAVQVTKLARENQPDALIREALREWDTRPGCDKPEFLPTVLSDVVKRSRAAPAVNGHDAKVADFLAYANQRPELEQ